MVKQKEAKEAEKATTVFDGQHYAHLQDQVL